MENGSFFINSSLKPISHDRLCVYLRMDGEQLFDDTSTKSSEEGELLALPAFILAVRTDIISVVVGRLYIYSA